MFLRSKIQEVILRRRSRSMNSAAQRSHVPDQAASSSTVPCDGDSAGTGADAGGKGAPARALFPSPRLLHSSSLPAGTFAFAAKSPARDAAEPESAAFSTMSPTSVLDAAAAFVPRTDGAGAGNGKRRLPWRARDNNGLADALDDDCSDQRQQELIVRAATSSSSSSLVRSCSLDCRVEFGVKNKSSWLPLRAGEATSSPAPADPREVIEPSSEDYTCVISRGPNPRTVHIFGDRVVEGGAGAVVERGESSPRSINVPARGDGGFFSL